MIDVNETEDTSNFDLDDLSQRLAERAEEWVPRYFPRGKRDHGDVWRMANIRGAPIRKQGSCIINLRGERAGCWADFATGGKGGPLSTLAEGAGLRGRELLEHAKEIVGDAPTPVVKQQQPTRTDEDKANEIAFILSGCSNPQGTPVETYLRARGLFLPASADLLFHPNLTDWGAQRGRPAMVAVIRDPVTGERTGGIHRTYLADDGSAKAETAKAKMMLGPSRGIIAMMRGADGVLGIGEGIETSLAASRIFSVPVWAALSSGNLRNFQFPPGLKKLLIFGDKGADGEGSARTLQQRAIDAGIEAAVMMPRSDDDFAKDLELGLWTNPALPPPNERPMEVTPPTRSVDELIEAAGKLTDTSPELYTVLRAACVLDPVSQQRILKEIKKSTRMGLGALSGIMKQYSREEKPKLKLPASWVNKMETYPDGEPKKIMLNVATALREDEAWRGVFGFNEFASRIEMMRPAPFEDMPGGVFPRPWTDFDDLRLTEWLQRRGLHAGREVVVQAIPVVAKENSFHPVRDWLDGLHWDGAERIDFWLQGYTGAEDNAYTRAVGARFLISAIARVYHPGCKVDCALILEGKQGSGKSTGLRALFDPWFTDQLSDLGSKDAAMQMQGVWGIELAELDAMGRVEVNKIKAFLGQTNDRFRPPYGRNLEDVPRQCVFCGSINDSHYLRDPTGGRRFWPIKCGQINADALSKVREQLWAEARARYDANEMWFLFEPELIAAAEEEQSKRYEGDPWDGPIMDYLDGRFPPNAWRTGEDQITTEELFSSALEMRDKSQWRTTENHRIGRVMRHLGWAKKLARIQGTNSRHNVWYRKMDS